MVLIYFLLNHSSLSLMHQHLPQSMLLGDAGIRFISPEPCGKRHAGPVPPTGCSSHVLIDTQPGRVELQRGPVLKVASSPSGPGREGSNQDSP
jgi:hypothetical protein